MAAFSNCERCGRRCYKGDVSCLVVVPKRTRVVGMGEPYAMEICQDCMETFFKDWLDSAPAPEFGNF